MEDGAKGLRWAAGMGLFAAVVMVPVGMRMMHPSLFSDDVTRIEQLLMAGSAGEFLFRPFNEHMAPLFQAVSWAAWRAAGRRLANAPMAFTAAAMVPHVLGLIGLGVLVRRETRSTATAMMAAAMMGLSGTISETYNWYSASSFSWAMLGTIAAIDAAGRAAGSAGKRKAGWLAMSAMACALAPAGSGIGLLAAPAAAARIMAAKGWRSKGQGLVPAIGAAAYLGICSLFKYRDVLADSLKRNVDIRAALRNIACAPADVLLPGSFGRGSWEGTIPDGLAMGIAAVGLIGVLIWAARDGVHRGLILAGLGLIVGGYGLTFGLRSFPGSPVVLEIQRYHLLPQLGLVILSSLAARPILSRFDASPRSSVRAGLVIASAFLVVQMGAIREHARFFRWPDQARTLAAIEHLDRVCRREGITRDQAIAALDPVRNRWFNHEFNALMMLPPGADRPRNPGVDVRAVLLDALDRSEREALFGGMDVSRRLVVATGRRETGAEGRLVRAAGFERSGPNGRWRASGWGSYLEYEIAPFVASEVSMLSVPTSGPVEVWWCDGEQPWSESRSVRWWPSSSSVEPADWCMPLDLLPHWDRGRVRRIRIVPRKAGEVAVGTPRLVR